MQPSKTKIQDDSMALGGRGFSRIHSREGWLDGEVVTPHGIVTVYAEDGYARLDFVAGGRLVMRNFRGKRMSKLALCRAAVKFAQEKADAQ